MSYKDFLAKISRRIFGNEIETYGFNEIIRKYSGYPNYLPLPVNVYHGWYFGPLRQSDINSDKSLLLTFNKRQADEWREYSKPRVAVLGAPFVHYRHMMNINKQKNASGTIAYPGHDATSINFVFDQRKFCEELAALDKKFHPITVSVLEMDIVNGKSQMYEDYGFKTFCPGPRNSIRFCYMFYSELAKHRYSCGNHHGANMFYSVEMGIPFFFIGEIGKGVFRHTGELSPRIRTPEQSDLVDQLKVLFSEPVDEVTPEQMNLIRSECGVEDCLTPRDLRKLLWRTLITKEVPKVLSRLAMWPISVLQRRVANK